MNSKSARSSRLLDRGLLSTFLVVGASCIQVRDAGNVDAPQGPTDLAVVAAAETPVVFEGTTSASLSAVATGGTPPYSFRWDQNGGPTVTLTETSSDSPRVDGLSAVDRYAFRVIVTDADGFRATAYASVEVVAAVTAAVPPFAIIGQGAALNAVLPSELRSATLLWQVIRGSATLDDPTSATPALTTLHPETVRLRLAVTLPGGDPNRPAERTFEVVSVADLRPRVTIETNFGTFVIELDGEHTPRHMANFLLYVDDGFYDALLFHRNACTENSVTGECEPFVLQGGGYRRVGGELTPVEPTRDPVAKENDDSPSNGVLYSVALALTGDDANSGTTQFFINLDANNSFLDDRGFTVFGNVVQGRDVIDAIVAAPRIDSPIIIGEVSLPAEDVIILHARRALR